MSCQPVAESKFQAASSHRTFRRAHWTRHGTNKTGVLAVTRSLGDASVKEFVVGSPYTTETALDENDEFLIVACDGVSLFMSLFKPQMMS